MPALGDVLLADVFPTVCFPNMRRLALHFGVLPLQIKEADPFQVTNALCPLLTWLEVVGPSPHTIYDSESDENFNHVVQETLSAQFLTRFPAIQTLEVAEGQVGRHGLFMALEKMPHLVADRLHLEVYGQEEHDPDSYHKPVPLPVL